MDPTDCHPFSQKATARIDNNESIKQLLEACSKVIDMVDCHPFLFNVQK